MPALSVQAGAKGIASGAGSVFWVTFYSNVALQQIVDTTVIGLGYDLVEIERSPSGLLRITIDLPWQGHLSAEDIAAGVPEQFVTVEDCEKVTRQLQFALEVDGVDYTRLEVSSPGIDRPLRHQQDYERFVGEIIDVTLKQPIGAAAAGQVSASRRKFRGRLERAPEGGEALWQIVWSEEPEAKPGARISQKRIDAAPLHAMAFTLEELREARLAPIVDFKGRKSRGDTGDAAESTDPGSAD
jgi:ribosome maturation factor RimP